MNGQYIYGIISTSDDKTVDIAGLGSTGSVHTIAHQGLGCVLSDFSGGEFSSMSKEEIVQHLLAHQVVVEHVMREHTVLPLKFGTVLATPDEVRDLLSQGHALFVAALAWIQDKVEVEVAATWDTEQVLREISDEEEIVRTRAAIASRRGQHTLEERIRLGRMVKASMDQRRDRYQERMIGFLRPVAVDVQPNALVSDQMVMNVAFLLERARQEEFYNQVSALNNLFHNQIDFRLIGPLPPYTFATVEVTRPSPQKIKEARQLLHLGEAISEPEIRKAYRCLAAESHPDRRPGDGLAKTRFAELRQASELLIAYCRGRAESSGSLLINIRRVRDEEIQHFRSGEFAPT
ncbi:MAG: GvpL/GvpF family gas vesicle protein [Chloroflexi bacterium]|nr:GvpL/GvpF family gas vesicle protein [Chloroflexota bacterium]MCL5075487.1 GvpL/GvpF family gas vesicle protein [Chloroflexota bacterium]